MIVLTGATGFVGSQLVARLRQDADLLLVSRDADKTRLRFPGYRVCDYRALRQENLTGATVVHLAARNNDRPGTLRDFREANVDCLVDVATIAKAGRAARFVNLCTTHALDPDVGDTYGLTKREGAERLAEMWPEGGINLYVPAIYGERVQGRLAPLNRLPALARRVALSVLGQAKPMISIDNLWATIQQFDQDRNASGPWGTEHYAADPVPARGLYSGLKRAVDVLAAVLVLGLLGWAMLLIALYVRRDSKGPAIFAQARIGRDGRVFTCYKFRTMTLGTAHAATHEVSASAVTKAGSFLRRTKLDELPQVFNVLLNQMSLVGPRPCLPVQDELIACRIKRDVLTVKPGITGLAQIRDIDMSDPARLAAWDDRYRAFRTSLGDVVILIRTALGGGSGDRIAAER